MPAAKNKPVEVSGPDKEQQDKWRVEEDLRTLQRAYDIIEDEDRLKAVRKAVEESGEMVDALEEVCQGLRRK